MPSYRRKNWLEVSLEVDPETAEAISEVFNRYGEGGAVLETKEDQKVVVVKTFLPTAPDGRLELLRQALWHLGQIRPIPEAVVRVLKEKDWAQAWKAYFKPFKVGRVVVSPSWHKYKTVSDETLVVIDPGMAFGTGLHPTTQMCLDAMQHYSMAGARVLDLGTGSGILAVAAAKLGARHVLALDIDPMAVKVAIDNVRVNRVQSKIEVREGSLEQALTKSFDLIIVNILAETIVNLVKEGLLALLAPRGMIIASGILDSEAAEVVSALQDGGIRHMERVTTEDWVTLTAWLEEPLRE